MNGASIRQEAGLSQAHYFHIELDRHDLLFADGLAAESYLDTGNRAMFANAGVPLVLHPGPGDAAAQRQREAMSCLPLCCRPAQVEPLWLALAARAEALGFALPVVATTDDPALCIVAAGRRFTPTGATTAATFSSCRRYGGAPGCGLAAPCPRRCGPGWTTAAGSG